ncbi:MAG: hypothetical protein O2992_15445 [Gemmatimonadetes bacterium]|jgi:hypothetical protein|nr:hypothetical protein [Gemmatimonadota bacterium]
MKSGIAAFAAATALILALTPAIANAQTTDVTWNVTWAQAVRINRDGPVEIQKWGDAELALTVDGGVVTGRWTTTVAEGVTWTVRGTLENGRLSLEATEHDSTNPELDMVEKVQFRATIDVDKIEGTVSMSFKGMNRDPGSRPFNGVQRSAR